MDRPQLADFLRTRREALQPEDVGLPRGPRRRTAGLRREEVAALSMMSTDYYGRLEQQRGPQPSEQMLASIARGLRLSLDERDHLFRVAGHSAPARAGHHDHVSPGLMRIVDRLSDTPATVLTPYGETLLQTPPAVALLGDQTAYDGLDRAMVHRWFTQPRVRDLYAGEHHDHHGRIFVSDLRAAYATHGPSSRAGEIVASLTASAPEFVALWEAHEIGLRHTETKHFVHPEVGALELHCQRLVDPEQGQLLLVFTATPGTESHDKLQLLAVVGHQQLARG